MFDERLKSDINEVVLECATNKKLARYVLNDFLRKHSFGSKLRRAITDYFYCAIRFYGEFEQNPEGFECEKAYAKLKESKCLDDIDTILALTGFDRGLYGYIKKNVSAHLLAEMFYRAPLTIRVNSMMTTRDKLCKDLQAEGYDIEPTAVSPFGLIFKKHINARQLTSFKKGLFEIQDEASQMVPFCMGIKPNDRVLDYCCGYGGKALEIKSMTFGSATVYVHDSDLSRLNVALKRSKMVSAGLKKYKKGSAKFDKVLVDVPCSGLGSMRRDADLALRLKPQDIEKFVAVQRDIFGKALENVRQGGFITYASCSFLKEENEMQVEYFLDNHNVKLINMNEIMDKKYIDQLGLDTFLKTSPQINGMDCLFAATFQVL